MALKTYLLAPNFTFEPDGPLRIGSIIADPLRPTKILHSFQTNPTIAKHVDLDGCYARTDSRAVHGEIWAQFLQTASLDLHIDVSQDVQTQYTMDSLITLRLKEDPTDEEATNLVQHPKIKATINAGLTGSAPVYMITGLKIAKGFKMVRRSERFQEGIFQASIPVTEQLSAGAESGLSRRVGVEDASQSSSDIIFAYQLHIIAQRKWWSKQPSVDLYAPKAAFLSETKPATEENEFGIAAIMPQQVLDIAEENEDERPEVVTLSDGEQNCVCISFKVSG
ncbi:hypothetical protein T440DRAFT_467122 [Plenodomus tracheiphilus IPT5]|uniref:Uncharacterized protein n=1 Tax=Plenodomus tracheiphilus IPT5 TaxID=1408161 RepID=A0A6A7B8R3_9PLEO|nr:hypothetical protein T440DRAFT_467122 [Plenodomus tracheiphilus IPT5]